jgi:hypothetical protein
VRFWFSIGMLLLSTHAHGETAEDIIEQAREVRTMERSIQTVNMVLVSKNGSERARQITVKARRDDDTIKSLIRFNSPSDVAGTTFLQIEQPDGSDEQMLYMPALKRVNRISGASRKGSFMGSDFSYEDLDLTPGEDATHTVVETTDAHWVIDTHPGASSTYGRVHTTVLKGSYLVKHSDFFDKEGAHVKTLRITETSIIDGKTLAKVSIMQTLKRNTSTRLEVIEQQLDVSAEALPDDIFTKAYLEQGN